MTDDNLRQEIEQLEEQGWHAESSVNAVEKRHQFPSFSETLSFLIELGDLASRLDAMPSIHIDGGTEVSVRVGGQPVSGLTADEIRLAKALAAD